MNWLNTNFKYLRFYFFAIILTFVSMQAAMADSPLASRTLDHDGITRSYLLYVPPGDVTAEEALPLVLVFHGGYGTSEQMATTTRMHELAAREGFIVAYPAAVVPEHHWNDGRTVMVPDVDDVGFVDAVIADIQAQHAVDSERIYATGGSNGGMMTLRLACERTQTFAAFAPVIANFNTDLLAACAPTAPAKIVFFHGTEDTLMPYEGGTIGGEAGAGQERGEAISAAATVEYWVEHNGCLPTPETVLLPDRARYDGTRVETISYSGCSDDRAVVQYRVEGGGHAWPGTTASSRLSEAGLTSRDISATKEIWTFFKTTP